MFTIHTYKKLLAQFFFGVSLGILLVSFPTIAPAQADLSSSCAITTPASVPSTIIGVPSIGEPSLQSILNSQVSGIDVTANQKNYQYFHTADASTTIAVQFIGAYSGDGDVFGYYKLGNPETFIPILKGGVFTNATYPNMATSTPGDIFTIVLPAGDWAFGINAFGINPFAPLDPTASGFYSTDISANTGDKNTLAVSYDNPIQTNSYFIGFEDWNNTTASDFDHNDMVVKVSVTGCTNPTPIINTAPTITLLGANPDTLTVGQPYVEFGATATDTEDGDLTSKIIETGGPVDTSIVGTTTLTYTVTDSGGLSASVERTVVVNPATSTNQYCPSGGDMSYDAFVLARNNGLINYSFISYSLTDSSSTSIAIVSIENNTGCTMPSSLSAYKMFDQLLSHQVLFDSTGLVHATSTTLLTVHLPTCMAQIDFWFGLAPTTLLDSNPYGNPPPPVVLTATLTNNSLCTNPAVIPQADLSVTKTVDNATPHEGDTVQYTITAQALGPATSTSVMATDALPTGLTFISDTASLGDYSTSTGVWTVGDMAASTTATLTINAKVNTGTAGQSITNIVVASESASSTDSNLLNNTASTTITVASNGGGGGGGGNGGTISFCLAIADSNNVIATSSLGLPLGAFNINLGTTTDVASSTNSIIDSQTWNTNTFAPNRMLMTSANDVHCVTYNNLPFGNYYYSQASTTAGTVWQTPKYNDQFDTPVNSISDFFNYSPELFNATTSDDASRNLDADGLIVLNSMNTSQTIVVLEKYTLATTTPIPNANLTTTKTVDKSSANVGDTLTYTINVVNNGPDMATGTAVTDVLPAGLTFVSASSTVGSYSTSTSIWTIGDLANGSSTSLTLVATVNSGTEGQTITNSAVASSTQPDLTPADNTATAVVTINTPSTGGGCTSNCGGGGGGSGCTVNCGGGNGPIVGSLPPSTGGGNGAPIVLGASTSTPVGASCYYLHDYLHIGWNNNPVEVTKLQVFLKDLEGYNVNITGIYDPQTVVALNAFQVKYADDILVPWDGTHNPSSFTYILTKKKVNEIYCQTAFPLTVQQQEIIDAYRQFINDLRANGVQIVPETPEQIQAEPTGTSSASTENGIGFNNGLSNLAIAGPFGSTTNQALKTGLAALFGFPWNWMKNIFDPSQCTPGTARYFIILDIIILVLLAVIIYLLWRNKRKK